MMKNPMMTYDDVGWSLMTKDTAAPQTHMMTTL